MADALVRELLLPLTMSMLVLGLSFLAQLSGLPSVPAGVVVSTFPGRPFLLLLGFFFTVSFRNHCDHS